MDVSIVLATYKRQDILKKTLESFSQFDCTSLEWELWVVDNAGDSATEKVVQAWAYKLPVNYLVELEVGKNNALNSVLDKVQGQLIVFTDDDIIVTPDWLQQLWQGAQRWPEHMVFGGRILPHWPEGFQPHDTKNPFLIGAYAIADWDHSEGEYEPKKVFGPNMTVRKKIFDDGWRFNTDIGPSQKKNYIMGSETEFVLRLFEAGHPPVYLPEALVYHQIRPEQMSSKWLLQRALRAGRGDVQTDSSLITAPRLLGMPRYLMRRVGEDAVAYAITKCRKKTNELEAGMRLYFNYGRLMQHFEKSKNEKK